MIKNVIGATLALILTVSATSADAQTRRRSNDNVADQLNAQVLEVLRPSAADPVTTAAAVTPTVAAPASTGMNLSRIYLGMNAGSNFRDSTDYQVGGLVGYQFHRNLAGELTYDYNRQNNGGDGQMVMGNLVASQRLGETAVTPYVLAGGGMCCNAFGMRDSGSNLALYNVGGGVRLNIVSNVDLDARYRYVGAFNAGETYNQHMVTGGLNIRF
jgi:opacity protein-like surface antigen